jgi:hypothetical protein
MRAPRQLLALGLAAAALAASGCASSGALREGAGDAAASTGSFLVGAAAGTGRFVASATASGVRSVGRATASGVRAARDWEFERVKPWERDILARPQMAFDPDPLTAARRSHVYFAKEASLDAGEAGGGGCGCN